MNHSGMSIEQQNRVDHNHNNMDEIKMDGVIMKRVTTVATMETLELDSGEPSDHSTSPASTPLRDETLSSAPSSPNPIHQLLVGVGHHLKKWQRAALLKSHSRRLHMLQQIKLEAELCKSPEAKMMRKMSRESMTEIGLALINPLHYDSDDEITANDNEGGDSHMSPPPSPPPLPDQIFASVSNDSNESHESYDVKVVPTQDDIPMLLSTTTMRRLVRSLPWTLQARAWIRLYSCLKDGDSFPAFLHHVRGHTRTLLVIETSKGEILGGFADAPWEQGTLSLDGCFFGSGQSFLYSVNEDENIQVHKWTALNDYSQFCRTGSVGMGGGGTNGTFGLFLHDHFTRGSSGPCETFGTEDPLCSQDHFEIVEFQVFGFVQEY